jgi:nicotinate-nucleotide adenylyltransferase
MSKNITDFPSIALFGGSFDPPHFGHMAIVKEALRELEIDKLIIVPAFLNPFKSNSFSLPHKRLSMSKEFFNDLDVIVDDYEIKEAKPTPTAKTLKYFQELYNVKYLIIGADNLSSIDKWYNFRWLNSEITWVIATRGGYGLDTSKLRDFKILEIEANISSTKIREKKEIVLSLDDRVERIVKELDKKKAEEIEVFDLENVDYIAKRVVLANSFGGKHSSSLSEHLKDRLKPLGEEFLHIDESDDWIVIDMGDIIVHIMSPTYRQKYSLEEFLTEISSQSVEEF